MSAAIELRGLSKSYGARRAVDDLSFEVQWGRVTGFLGPNGAGKTTTMRMLLGLVHASAGEAVVDRRSVGALLESHQFHPKRRGRAHLRWLASAMGVGDDRVDAVLEEVELQADADRRVKEYSLGMRQRLGLAAALLNSPRVLVLDEPANGLDPAGMRWLRRTLRRFADEGGAVLLSSHQLRDLAEVADDVVVINRGRLVTTAAVDDLLAAAGSGDLEDVFLDLTEETKQ